MSRLLGYVRVSQVNGRDRLEGRFISPAVQEEAIRGYAAAHGDTIVEVLVELDESGARADRPLLTDALARIERGEIDGLVVAKLDRFGRSLIDGLQAIERISKAGSTFASVADGLDLRTDSGRLVLRIMLSLAEFELDRIRTSWQIASERAVARGMYVGSVPPAGYRRQPDGHLAIDQAKGPAVRRMFEARAAGASITECSNLMQATGLRTSRGHPHWPTKTIANMLVNRVYLGEVSRLDLVTEGAHPALIEPELFAAAQQPHAIMTPRRLAQPAILSGVLRCAGCGLAMYAQTCKRADGTRTRAYHCHGWSAAGRCPAPGGIGAADAEPHIEACFFTVLWKRQTAAEPAEAAVAAAEGDAVRLESLLSSYRDADDVLEALGPTAYAAGLRRRQERLTSARALLHGLRQRNEMRETAASVEAQWPLLSAPERSRRIKQEIEAVFVRRQGGPPSQRLVVYERGQGPASSLRGQEARSNEGPKLVRAGRLRPALVVGPRWTDEAIRAQLEDAVGRLPDRRWPRWDELTAMGHSPVLRQMERAGGAGRWAYKLQVRPVRPVGSQPYWNEFRTRSAIAEVMLDRTDWPSVDDWRELRLWPAVRERGNRWWAREFGFRAATRR